MAHRIADLMGWGHVFTDMGVDVMRAGAARGHVGNFHEAGFYGSDAEFAALIVPFIEEGVAAGEPVIIGYDDRKAGLLRSWLADPSAVEFIADQSLYATPARAIATYRRLFEFHTAMGAGQIRIAGPPARRGPLDNRAPTGRSGVGSSVRRCCSGQRKNR